MSSTLLTQELYFTTSTVIDWMDVFTRPLYKHIILESLEYCQANKGLDLYAWVLMTNHLPFGRICNPPESNISICNAKKHKTMSSTLLTQELYFITSTVIDWMDVFTRPLYKHIILESLEYCQANKGLDLYAWVLMTNHLHLIVGVNGGNTIGDVLRDFKKFTSKGIVKAIQENDQESRQEWLMNRFQFRAANDKKITNFKFWQEDNHVENIYSYDFYRQKLDYIHQNPVRQEIVARAEDYMYSSARNYAGMEGLLKVIVAK